VCAACGCRFPVADGIADFAQAQYYDRFVPGQQLTAGEKEGLENEVAGTVSRIREFYQPLLARQRRGQALRVLDSGCGNGLSVDLLRDAGYDAWGVDLSALRKWQWLERAHRDRLACADSLRLPFADGAFDAILCSGVLEHVGVSETGGERYAVRVLPERDADRIRFLAEHARVLAPGGVLLLDFPNGAFPIDFWHGTRAGSPRWHRRDEGFLPTLGDVRRYAAGLEGDWKVRPLPPHGRLQFRQVGRHWWGRLLAGPASLHLRLMAVPPWRLLLRTGLNPFLVLELRRPDEASPPPR
jgi:SAM-dependent methyltransferase